MHIKKEVKTMSEHYDFAIIGAGPGGYTAAISAKAYNKKVALIENKFIGGVCLNTGCIPTKSYFVSSHLFRSCKKAKTYGINIDNLSIDFPHIYQKKTDTINTMRRNLENLIKSHGVDIIKGKAKFISENTLKIEGENEKTISADKIIIATGSEIKKLPPPLVCDHKDILDSSSILELNKLPKSLLIVGGGYIGCEIGSIFSDLGSEVTIVEALPSIIYNQEKKLQEALTSTFKNKKKIKIFTNAEVKNITKKDKELSIELSSSEVLIAEKVLLSIGRDFNTDCLDLDKATVKTNKNKSIAINPNMQTSNTNIYAIGDVNHTTMLAHGASHQAHIAIKHAITKEGPKTKSLVPSVIFTDPEMASVGLTQQQAEKDNISYGMGVFPFMASGMAQVLSETEGFAMIMYEKATKKIIGAHIYGYGATTLISDMAIAIEKEMTLDQIIETIYAHPTLSEVWHDAAYIANETPMHIPPIRK